MTHQPVPHADRDRSEQPRTIRLPQGFADHFGIPAEYHASPTPSTATAGSDPTQGTSRPVSARVVRASEAQVEAAMRAWHRVMPLTGGVTLWQAIADAVVVAGDADEVTRLRAERTPGAWPTPEQFVAEWDALTREQQIAQAERIIDGVQRGSRCFQENHYRRIPDLEAKAARLRAGIREVNLAAAAEGRRRDAAEAERERLAEVVARVEALHRTVPTGDWCGACGRNWPCPTIAALSGPTPAQTPAADAPQGPGATNEAPGQSGTGQALGGAEKGEGAGR